ncbi:anthrax toxin-like adenylyl cyclase domain-containing protein [Pelagibaculum spongiae]|uniref:Anthrax toxin edema factor central domain-containing protein n=1 Tax=Pelagibaculum spongiae TaxID=2080658 RepID=A0A2V1H6I5_9GAMM|nr:anthrax toxin-like adenylyl cyclase domain-containing protein [Pelagibaculum spongiae]PVZ72375.1 hypothetical protein DC094_05045 [Pelagibaculum spongiae]
MKSGKQAVEGSGIVESHAWAFCNVAKANECFILIRPVNAFSPGLIKENYATKGLHVKGKSSSWGPHAGLIAEDQQYSKLRKRQYESLNKRLINYNKFTSEVTNSLSSGAAKKIPLIITKNRFLELKEKKTISIHYKRMDGSIELRAGDDEPVFWLIPLQSMKNGKFDNIPATKKVMEDNIEAFSKMRSVIKGFDQGYLVLIEKQINDSNQKSQPKNTTNRHPALQPFYVLANKKFIPLTADYDLFTICPKINLIRDFKTPIQEFLDIRHGSLTTSGQLWHRANRRISAALEQDNITIDQDKGEVSVFQKEIIRDLNFSASSLGYQGGDLVHHGCETANPVTELDYPITVICPGGLILAAENIFDIQQIAREIQYYGYIFLKNKRWPISFDSHLTAIQLEYKKKTGKLDTFDDRFDVENFKPTQISPIHAVIKRRLSDPN